MSEKIEKAGWTNVSDSDGKVVGCKYNNEQGIVTFVIDDFCSSELTEKLMLNEVARNALVYGVKVKLERATARKKDEVLTNAEKIDVMQRMLDNLIEGHWTQKREKVDPKVKVVKEMLAKANELEEGKKEEAINLIKVMFPDVKIDC